MKKTKIIAIIIIAFIAIVMVQRCPSGQDLVNDLTPSEKAYLRSEAVVKEALKSPSSAVFPSYSEIQVIVNKQLFTVNAYVDSDNSFGANIRTKYTVQMTLEGDKWVLKTVMLDGKVVFSE